MSTAVETDELADFELRVADYHFAREGREVPPPDESLLYDYVFGADYTFVRTRCPGIDVCFPIGANWHTARGLAEVEPYLMWDLPRVPSRLVEQMYEIGWKMSVERQCEALFHLSWLSPAQSDELAGQATAIASAEGWVLEFPEQIANEERVKPVHTGAGSSAARSIIEVHTHPDGPAKFSPVDDKDEARGVKIYAVMGELFTKPELRARVSIYGHFCEYPATEFFELPAGLRTA